jgi:Uma2 family endonuclease
LPRRYCYPDPVAHGGAAFHRWRIRGGQLQATCALPAHKLTLGHTPVREERISTAALNRYTPEEYLALERHAEFKSEYIDGRIIAMSPGVSFAHNRITGNVYAGLLARFAGRECHVFISDIKVRFGAGRNYTYPDVAALCGSPHCEDEYQDTLTNPSLLVEVLSPSTQTYDRTEKFAGYKAIASLREYVLIAQDQVRVEIHTRHGDFWSSAVETGIDATVTFASVNCSVTMREIYARTPFAPVHEGS